MTSPGVLSIGTTHPWNTAGVGLDARIASEFGVEHCTVVVGVTAQDERGIVATFALPETMVRAQLESAARANIASIRVGAIFNEENVREIVRFLNARAEVPAVVDPVFGATSGGTFGGEETFGAFRAEMLALPVILTPNIPEAERLLARAITDEAGMIAAAQALRSLGARAVLLKGGHLAGDPLDVLATASHTTVYREERIAGTMPGTGCTLAAALACELAKGRELAEAVESARAYVREKIREHHRLP